MRGTSRIGVGLLSVALVATAGACGGDDDAADTTPATAPAASATTPAAPGSTEAAAPTSVAEPPATSEATASTAPVSVPTFTGDPDSEFCGVAREIDVANEDPENPFDSAFYERMITTVEPMYDKFLAAAPSEIAADVAVEAQAFHDLADVFAEVDYQFLDVDLASVPDSPEIDAAKARVDAYLDQVCGIERDDDDDSDPPAKEGTVRDLLIAQFESTGATTEQADCMVDFLASAPSGSDVELGIAVMAACGFTQPLIDAGFSEEDAECAVDHLSTAELDGSEIELGIALVAACGITEPLVDAGFSEEEAQCVVEYLADSDDIDTSDTTELGLDVIRACDITRFFTERGFTEEQATCMLERLEGVADVSDDDEVIEQLVEACVLDGAPPTTAG